MASVTGLFGLSLLLRHWDPLPLKFPSKSGPRFRVEVLNGSGRSGSAAAAAERLRQAGLDVVYVGNADSFDYPWTLIVDRVGCPECARTVGEVLGCGVVRAELDSMRLVEVTVILGRDSGSAARD